MKRISIVAIVFGLVAIVATAWFWFVGWTHRSSISGQITRIQYFESPSLVAIHVESPVGVFVIPQISGSNQDDFSRWLDLAKVEIKSLDITASSIHDKWSDRFEERDSVQFGVHGLPRGDTKPNYGGEVAVGIAQEDFPYQSFRFMTEEEFAKLTVGKPINDSNVFGRFNFSEYFHVSPRKKPFIIP